VGPGGAPITQFCDLNRLSVPERLGLFVSVCQAVQHAHQKGIIHRDLKPSNVLVTLQDDRPVPKVIDFGVAKALGQPLTDKTLYTNFAQMIGTPLYMSPEQAQMSGLDIDTRSDVYSLGVLLYELLTGTTPFDRQRFKEAGYDEVRRIIREEEPPRPSTRLSTLGQAATTILTQRKSDPKRLSQLVRGELDWIVMKALEKDRDRRYQNVSAFAADVQRFLHDEPVTACPPSAWYRSRKFARRYRGPLATAAVVSIAVVLAVAAVAGSIGWAARDRTAREAALDEAVTRDLDEAEPLLQDGKWPEASAALERAAKLLEAGGRTEFPPRLHELQQDLTMARRLEEIYSLPGTEYLFYDCRKQDVQYARLFQEYGIDMAALSAAEAAERIRARSIRLALARGLDLWFRARLGAEQQSRARKLFNWQQLVEVSNAKKVMEVAKAADPDPWRNQLREALMTGDFKALEALAASADVSKVPPGNLCRLAYALYEAGDDRAEGAKQAVALLRKAQWQYPGDFWINHALGDFYGFALRPPEYDGALRFYTAALALRPHSHYTIHSIGNVLLGKGSSREVIAEFDKAMGLKPDYSEPLWNRAAAYLALGQRDKAFADWARAIELAHEPVRAWVLRGQAYAKLGDWDKAISDFSKAIELDPNNAPALRSRSRAYAHLGQWGKAIADYSKDIELNPTYYPAWHDRGWAYQSIGQWEKAIADYSRVIELREQYLKEAQPRNQRNSYYFTWVLQDPTWARTRLNRARAYTALGQWDKANIDFSQAIQVFSEAIQLDPKNTVSYNNLAWLLATCPAAKFRDPGRAAALAQKAVELAPKEGSYWNTLGAALYRAGEWSPAIAALEKSMSLRNGGDSFDWFFLAMAHWQSGENKEACRWYANAVEWMDKRDPKNEELRRFRAEAAELLGIKEQTTDREDTKAPKERP
jgi:tetratricopeptide (TPR) repeat protein